MVKLRMLVVERVNERLRYDQKKALGAALITLVTEAFSLPAQLLWQEFCPQEAMNVASVTLEVQYPVTPGSHSAAPLELEHALFELLLNTELLPSNTLTAVNFIPVTGGRYTARMRQ